MEKELQKLISEVKDKGAHIFYSFEDQEKYVNNLLDYVSSAIQLGNHVMIIENDRLLIDINQRIANELKPEQMEMVHTINNYDFYCYRGNFHKETILSYLDKMITPFLQNNIPIQTWAHVEWREQKEIFQTLGEYETEADKMLQATKLVTICCYDANRVPQSLKEILLECHDFYMTDERIDPIDRKVKKY